MLTTDEIRAHLKFIEYKDWKFALHEHPYEGPFIRITFGVEDTYNPGEMVTLGINSFLPSMRDREALLQWLLDRIIRIEIHEAREFFKYDGEVFSNPHAPEEPYDIVLAR